jgi:hypothetical protein
MKTMLPHTIIDFFLAKTLFKLSDLGQMKFVKDLILLIIKGYMPLSNVKNIWLSFCNMPM